MAHKSEQVTVMAGLWPNDCHWKQKVPPAIELDRHGVSFTPAITYGVPRRSMTPSPVRLQSHTQSEPDATILGE